MNCFHMKRSALFFCLQFVKRGKRNEKQNCRKKEKGCISSRSGTWHHVDAGRQDHSQGQSVLSYCWLLCKRLTQPGGINLSPRDTDFTIKDLGLSSSVESSQDSLPRKITFCYTQLNLHKTHLNVDSDHLV